MKKKLFRYPLMAALACGLSMGFVACSDDDDNKNGGIDTEVMNEDQTDEAIKAWAWVSVLTDETDQQDGWQDKSYTVTIGEPSSNHNNARLIYVSDLQDAQQRFAAFAGCKPEELTGAKIITAGEFGKMEWTPSAANAANLAVVKVESKLFKQLDQIIFCTEEQAPDNAADITGNCYYRLGDVIEDKDGYYWVCVQPSFLGKKNKDSYWVNIFNANPQTGEGQNTKKTPGIPEKNIYSKYDRKYNNNTIKLPTCLKMDRKQNYNLSNLVWAMKDTTEFKYFNSVEDGVGIAGLPKEYHSLNYIKLVDEGWRVRGIYEKLFNCTKDDLKKMTCLSFFYYGYHWKIGSTAGVWVYRGAGYNAYYTGSLDDDDTLFEMKDSGYGFDIRRYAGDPNADKDCATANVYDPKCAPDKQFLSTANGNTSNEGYWVIRVATGKQLDKNYDPYKILTGVYDIYRFNDEFKFLAGNDASIPKDEALAKLAHD